jgi:signal transduction histidine kinase
MKKHFISYLALNIRIWVKQFLIVCIFFINYYTAVGQNVKIDSLLSIVNESELTQRAKIYNEIARSFWYVSVDSSLKYAQLAYDIAHSEGILLETVKALSNFGVISDIQGDYGRSLNFYFSIIDLAVDNKIFLPEIPNSFLISIDEMYSSDSITIINKAFPSEQSVPSISSEDRISMFKILSNTYVNIGIVYGQLSQYEKSLASLNQSLRICKDISDEKGMGVVLINLGTVYLKLEYYDLAKKAYIQAISIRKKYNDQNGIANGYLAMGELYHATKIIDSAMVYLNQAELKYQQLNNKRGLAQVYTHLGEILGQSNKPFEAIDYLRKALIINRYIKNREGIAITNLRLGDVYCSLNEFNNALETYKIALTIGKELGHKSIVANALLGQALIFERQNLISSAYKVFKDYHEIYDSIQTEKLSAKIIEYQTLFQVNEHEKENKLLKKENEIKVLKLKRQKTIQSLLIILILVVLISGISLLMLYNSILKANKKLIILNSELELRVDERTKDLREALKIAEDANNLKNSFLSNISHEIRTPLNGIMGFSSLIANEVSDNQDVQRYINEIRSSSDRLMYLLNNLIDISRAESKNFRMRLVSCNINDLIDYTILSLEENTTNAEVKISKDCNVIPDIMADKDNLIRVFSIIIGNALKYTHKGSIKISTIYNEAKSCIDISITDSGVGIDPDYLPFIFEPFRQESTGLTRSFQGAGLGLPLAKRIVQLIGGEIEITSRKNIGTIVLISFPLKINKNTSELSLSEDLLIHAQKNQPKARKAKVLIIEENSYTRFYLQTLLRRYVQVAVARNGSEALSLIADSLTFSSTFDLIIVDINITEPWNPANLIKEIKLRKPIYLKRPFVLQAEKKVYEKIDKNLYESFGYQQIILKPIDKDILLGLLRVFSPVRTMF